jgi:hypothetical protein
MGITRAARATYNRKNCSKPGSSVVCFIVEA